MGDKKVEKKSFKKRKKIYLVTTFIGVFAIDEKNKIIGYKKFSKDPAKIAERLKLSESKVIEEEKHLMNELKKYDVVKNKKQFIKENLRDLAVKMGFVENQIEFNQLLTKVNLELTKVKIRKAIRRDKLIIQTIGAIEELEKFINIFVERIREIYSFHFPEMDRIIKDHKKFCEIIEKFGYRDKIKDHNLKKFAEKSMGIEFKEEDIKTVKLFAKSILQLYDLKEKLTSYLEKSLKEIAPNFTELATSILAAKLIAKAGGLEKLARMSSSTIQLLGSEKRLFQYLRGRGKPPKYGILFAHPLIQKAPKKHKGKVARALASKLSVAAKLDFYSKKYMGKQLENELKKRLEKFKK